jgi:hypothetical protein
VVGRVPGDAVATEMVCGVAAMPGLTGTLYDETYDLDVLAGTDYELALPYVTAFDLGIYFGLVTAPRIVFIAVVAPAALVSTIDVLTWQAPASLAALVSATRAQTFSAANQPAALVSTIDVLTWQAVAAPAALSSQARGGG